MNIQQAQKALDDGCKITHGSWATDHYIRNHTTPGSLEIEKCSLTSRERVGKFDFWMGQIACGKNTGWELVLPENMEYTNDLKQALEAGHKVRHIKWADDKWIKQAKDPSAIEWNDGLFSSKKDLHMWDKGLWIIMEKEQVIPSVSVVHEVPLKIPKTGQQDVTMVWKGKNIQQKGRIVETAVGFTVYLDEPAPVWKEKKVEEYMGEDFKVYLSNAKDRFILAVRKLDPDVGFKVACEDLIIAFDQAKDHITFNNHTKGSRA